MMPVGARAHADASARISVPTGLPLRVRAKVRELVAFKSGNPGNGEADALLTKICGEADRTGTPLILHVSPLPGTDKDRLAALYARHGFGPFQAEPLLMSRMPA